MQETSTRYCVESAHLSGLSILSKLNIPGKFLLETVFTMPSYKDCFLKNYIKRHSKLATQ